MFTPVKSVSLLWALGSAATRQAVEDAHHEAVENTLAWLETETAFARKRVPELMSAFEERNVPSDPGDPTQPAPDES